MPHTLFASCNVTMHTSQVTPPHFTSFHLQHPQHPHILSASSLHFTHSHLHPQIHFIQPHTHSVFACVFTPSHTTPISNTAPHSTSLKVTPSFSYQIDGTPTSRYIERVQSIPFNLTSLIPAHNTSTSHQRNSMRDIKHTEL